MTYRYDSNQSMESCLNKKQIIAIRLTQTQVDVCVGKQDRQDKEDFPKNHHTKTSNNDPNHANGQRQTLNHTPKIYIRAKFLYKIRNKDSCCSYYYAFSMEKGLKKVVSAPHLQLLLPYTLRNINTQRIKILICQICS